MASRQRLTVLRVRVASSLANRLEQEARRSRTTKSAVVRQALENAFGERLQDHQPAEEARRQSLLVSRRASESEVAEFIEQRTDGRGWQ